MSFALLSEMCALLGDARRAAVAHRLLRPYATRNVIFTAVPAVAYGSVSRSLGMLAATTSSWDEAVGHFEAAVEMNARMGARPWVAHTQHDYAAMLLARGTPSDHEKALTLVTEALGTAQELGMKMLAEKVLALKARAEEVVG